MRIIMSIEWVNAADGGDGKICYLVKGLKDPFVFDDLERALKFIKEIFEEEGEIDDDPVMAEKDKVKED